MRFGSNKIETIEQIL